MIGEPMPAAGDIDILLDTNADLFWLN